jgi:signal transduction histidine kinase
MNWIRRWRRPPPVAVLSSAVFLVLAGIALAINQERLSEREQARQITSQANVFAASVAAAVYFGDRTAEREYIEAMRGNQDIEGAAIYDTRGRRIAYYRRGEADVLGEHLSDVPPGFGDGSLNIVVPIVQSRMSLGSVAVRAMTQPFFVRVGRYAGLVLIVTLGALVMLVQANAQIAADRANRELALRARDLSDTNLLLQREMEERQKTEEALRQSQKMDAIGRLSGGIAHDFNNLLTVIKGNLQLLRRRLPPAQADLARYIVSADEALTRAASLTQRILAFSRRQPLSPVAVNLSALVTGMDEFLRHSAGETVNIVKRLDADWWTLCDHNQMENVILNLVINARDAMPEGGSVSIETRNAILGGETFEGAPGEYVELVIRDTGSGMSDEVRQKAIEPFFTTKPQGRGTGLGLSTAFGFVKQSNGHFDIESEIGKGTTIRIAMPRHNSPEI